MKCRELVSLDYLGIACKELEVHQLNRLELLPSFDFHFSEATNFTMDHLTACKGLKISDRITKGWRYINACKTGTDQVQKVFAFLSWYENKESHSTKPRYELCLPDQRRPWYSPLDALSRWITY